MRIAAQELNFRVTRGSLRGALLACAAAALPALLSNKPAISKTPVQAISLFQAVNSGIPITQVNAGVNGNPPYMLQSIVLGEYTVTVDDLALGTSSIVEGSATGSLGTNPGAADNFDLNDIVARTSLTGANAEWRITMIAGREKWRDCNDDNADFFIFEAGGNDAIEIRAILLGGALGEPITISLSEWTRTGLYKSGQPNSGHPIAGVAFASTELFDEFGMPLANNAILEGIQVTSGTLDPCCFCAVTGPVIPNNPPSVDAGDPQSIIWPFAESVVLAGAVSDDDPSGLGELTVLWSQVSGSGEAMFDNSAAAVTRCSFSAPGIYELKLEAWDELMQAGADIVTITVAEPTCPPGDVTADCKVTLSDLMAVADEWLSPEPTMNLIGNPTLDMADYTFLADSWLKNWTGSVTVTLSPEAAITDGAQWRINEGPWRHSGTRHNDLVPGPHVIRFKAVDNWVTPADRPVDVGRSQAVSVAGPYAPAPPLSLIISEIMASNSTSTADERNEYDDWIEIRNFGDSAIDLAGLYLTDDPDEPDKWRFPADAPAVTSVPAGGYLLIWADGETDEGPLHAAFSLASDKGRVALFAADASTVVDSLTYGRQPVNVSCGRVSETDMQVKYFTVPTPKAANSSTYPGMVADTEFSHNRGFYVSSFDVEIACATENATIHYTLDGSPPTANTGNIYTEPIAITTTTVLRAAAFLNGWLPTNVDTHTYIFPANVIHQPAVVPGYPNPRSWLGGSSYADHDYAMDPRVVDDPAYSDLMVKAMTDIPTLSLSTGRAAMDTFYWGSGESAASMELIYRHEPDKDVQVDCVVEPHSHNRMKRSIRLNFRSEYGDARFRSSLFRDAPLNGDSAAEEVDRIVLRGGNNRSWARIWNPDKTTYTMDQWYRDTQISMSGTGVHGTFVHLYINGLYWGLYNPVERPDAWFTSSYMGGEKEDWFSVSHGGAHGGSATRWNYLQGELKDKNMSDPVNYAEMQQYLHIDHYIDYVMLCWYIGMTDWPGNNWWGGNRNDVPGPFMYFAWDGEWSWETGRDGHNNGWVHPDFRSKKNGGATLAALWHSLRKNDDFMIRFADRAYKHLFNGGVLTNASAQARYRTLNDFIRDAVVAESARWGDACEPVGHPLRTRDVDWLAAETEMLGPGFMADNAAKFVASLRAEGYYPGIDPPVFNQHGGQIGPGFQVTMSSPDGTGAIYYTLDGSDPRQAAGSDGDGGGIAPGAAAYSGAVTLLHSAVVKARVKAADEWSALAEAIFAVGPLADNLRISEIMYHPAKLTPYTDGDLEYVEVQNIGEVALNLALVCFSKGISFTFPDICVPAGGYVVVVSNRNAFDARYPQFAGVVAGEYSGRLDNSGERIRLEDAVGATIVDFKYTDGWFDITDGGGFSLTARDPANTDDASWGDKASWRPSAQAGGSPGGDDSGVVPLLGSVVINELLAHSSDLAPDWIELHNTTAAAIHIGGWYLSDNNGNRSKYEIAAGVTIPAHGFLVFYEDQHFNNTDDPGCHTPFALSENGEVVYLTSGLDGVLTGYTDEESFGATERDVSLGRYGKSTGTFNFVAMSSQTPGLPNAYPKVGPVVISEIMYNPGSNADAEYVELLNIRGGPVTLYDSVTSEPWKFHDDGGFELFIVDAHGQPVSLAAGERILLVKSRAAFASTFSAPGDVQVLEWSGGSLNNAGERIELAMPGDVDALGVRQYIRVDRVVYSDGSHPAGEDRWPASADGAGDALHRKTAAEYGNDVINWQAAAPSPGT